MAKLNLITKLKDTELKNVEDGSSRAAWIDQYVKPGKPLFVKVESINLEDTRLLNVFVKSKFLFSDQEHRIGTVEDSIAKNLIPLIESGVKVLGVVYKVTGHQVDAQLYTLEDVPGSASDEKQVEPVKKTKEELLSDQITYLNRKVDVLQKIETELLQEVKQAERHLNTIETFIIISFILGILAAIINGCTALLG